MARSYRQGLFKPINFQKYEGDPTNIIFRSSWEKILFNWFDRSANCVLWSSEEVVIGYMSPVDGKMHRYFVDAKATFKQKDGSKKTFLIEIKPFAQTLPPKNTRNKRVLMEAVATYQVNQAKWEAARRYCEERNWTFQVVTEYELGLKKRDG